MTAEMIVKKKIVINVVYQFCFFDCNDFREMDRLAGFGDFVFEMRESALGDGGCQGAQGP